MRFLEGGNADPTFNNGQGVSLAYGLGESQGQEVSLMRTSDTWTKDDILIGGLTKDNQLYIARLNFAGEPQGPFGNGGIAVVPFHNPHYSPMCVTGLYSDDRGAVYVCGAGNLGGSGDFIDGFVVKLTNNGAYDHTFGEEGCYYITRLNASSISARSNGDVLVGLQNSATHNELFYCIANKAFKVVRVQTTIHGSYCPDSSSVGPADCFILGGDVVTENGPKPFAAKFDAKDNLVDGFGTKGVAILDYQDGISSTNGLAVSNSGKTAIIGNIQDVGFTVAVLKPNGQLDSAFSGDGKRVIRLPGIRLRIAAVAFDKKERIVVCGETGDSSDIFLMRFTPDGEIDAQFGGDDLQAYPGLVVFRNFQIPQGAPSTRKAYHATSLVITAEQKLVVGGTCYE